MTENASPPTQTSRDTVIACARLTKVFKDFWLRDRVRAVDGIDLDIRRGEVFGLLGPNGSGKSTTIKMILGLLHPTSGRILVFGKRPEDVETKKRIGYLPEESYLYPFLNARETLDYYGKLFHLPAHSRSKRTDELLEQVGLEHAQRRPIGEYSKGMQRRIGLAQALINDPDLLILDEPTAGMDPLGTADVKRLITMLAERGKTIVLCSHLLADVEDVCDRVAVMYAGRIAEEGTIDELLRVEERTAIETESLDEQTISRIDELLTKSGRHIERVHHPRQTLERKFLELVEREQSNRKVITGARSGGRIADFLSTPGAAASESVIDQLIRPDEPAEAPPEPAAPQPTAIDRAAQDEVLSSLTGSSDEAGGESAQPRDDEASSGPTAPSESASDSQPPPPTQQADRNVLDALLGDEEDSKEDRGA